MLSIIIPAHNEEKRISNTLEAYGNFFQNLKYTREIDDFEILIILNNCTDKTLEIVDLFSQKFEEIKYLDFEQGGKGFAVMQGFRSALSRGIDIIGFVDADMATKPEYFYDLVKNLGNYDGIIASRGMKKSIVNTSFKRKLTNRGFNFIVRGLLFLPFADTQCGAKLFRKRTIEQVIDNMGRTAWAFDVDLLYQIRKKKLRIKEIPTVWDDIEGSKLNLTTVPIKMFSSILRLRILHSPFKFIIRLYDKFPEKLKFHNL